MSFLTSDFVSNRRLNQPILPFNSIQIQKNLFKKLLTTTPYKNGGEKNRVFLDTLINLLHSFPSVG